MEQDKNINKHLEGRVSVLENAMINLAKTVDDGFEQQQKTSKELWAQIKGLSESQKPNYMLYVAALGVMLSVCGGLYVLSVRPILLQLQEVDTQFDADAQLRNVQFSEQQRLNALIWDSTSLGQISKFPSGPYYQPNISHRGKASE